MGITIVRKSKQGEQRYGAKTCLVLAGGAVSGGAFKVGGLKALNDFLINKKVTDFDMYVGLSAGALLAAALASNVGPEEMLKSLEGRSDKFSQLKPWDFYYPNVDEAVRRPVEFMFHVMTFFPAALIDLTVGLPDFAEEVAEAMRRWWKKPTWAHMEEVLSPMASFVARNIDIPNPARELMPSGLFDNRRLETYLRSNIERNGQSNDFVGLYRQRGKELYIAACNLDSAEREIFGHDEVNTFTISQAVQASAALPGFYKPVRLGHNEYVDGGVRKTANIDAAAEHGAKLIIVYNPFRPIVNPAPHLSSDLRKKSGARYLSESGIFTVLNQVLRTLLHTRLHLGVETYRRDPNFDGDLIVIEPTESDQKFFSINPLAFWLRVTAAEQGYRSTILSIERRFDEIKSILQVYGIEISRHFVREEVRRLKTAHESDEKIRAILEEEHPRRDIRLAHAPGA